MVGAAERALSLHFREIVDDLVQVVDGAQPMYATSSGFRYSFDPSASRDVADTSAAAKQVGVQLRSVAEQPFDPPPGSAPGTVQRRPPTEAERPADMGTSSSDPWPSASVAASISAATRSPSPAQDPPPAGPGTQTLLTVPATVAGRERAGQGCEALANGWYVEAEQLFLDGAEYTPIDPFVWFGAGLAAAEVDPGRAGDHLVLAGRYLLADDPAGAAYAFVLAAGLKETAGDARAARQLLQAGQLDLPIACPSISLHLARLGPERNGRIGEALAVDPMLEVDVAALGFDVEGELVKQRLERTERELSLLDFSIAELRRVDGGSSWPDNSALVEASDDQALSLIQIEIALWRKVEDCQQEIEIAQRLVAEKGDLRRDREADLARMIEIAEADLVNRTTVPFFVVSMIAAASVVLTFVAGRSLATSIPSLRLLFVLAAWLVQIVLVGWAVRRFYTAFWPHRRFRRARQAKIFLPQLEWEVSQLRETEFEYHRRFVRASQDAELKIRRIIDRREFLIPKRPTFLRVDDSEVASPPA